LDEQVSQVIVDAIKDCTAEGILSSIRSWAREPLLSLPNVPGAGATG